MVRAQISGSYFEPRTLLLQIAGSFLLMSFKIPPTMGAIVGPLSFINSHDAGHGRTQAAAQEAEASTGDPVVEGRALRAGFRLVTVLLLAKAIFFVGCS